jgi:hypothetical protein
MPSKLLERLLMDRDTLQADLEAVLALLASRLAKKYGWTRDVTARFLEHQVYVAVLRFRSVANVERSVMEFERALDTVRLEAEVAAKVSMKPTKITKPVKKARRAA